jgi:hypothetical protein
MEILGSILLICMVMLFGVSALAAAFEASEKKRQRLDKHRVKHTDGDNT